MGEGTYCCLVLVTRRAFGRLLFRTRRWRVLHSVCVCRGLSEACRHLPDSVFPALQEVSVEKSPPHLSRHQRCGVNSSKPSLLVSDQGKVKGLGGRLHPRSPSFSASSSTGCSGSRKRGSVHSAPAPAMQGPWGQQGGGWGGLRPAENKSVPVFPGLCAFDFPVASA